MIACGPFTPNNTNDFAPLHDLLEQVEASPPDLLILVGYNMLYIETVIIVID